MNSYGIIYLITNLINNKMYVGQTIQLLRIRFASHCTITKFNQRMLVDLAIQKYGKENFSIEQIDSAQTQEELDLKEILWIEYLGTHTSIGNGYNICWGGNGKGKVSLETKEKISNAHKGKIYTEETKRRMSESSKNKTHTEKTKKILSQISKGNQYAVGNIPWNKGKTNIYSKETLIKMSKAKIGKICTEETKRKMSESSKGQILSQDHKRKISEFNKGEKNGMAKLTKEQAKEIRNLLKSGKSQRSISKMFNVSTSCIFDIKHNKSYLD